MDITKLKVLLSIVDETEDQLLEIIKEHSQWRIKAYIGMTEDEDFPNTLDWVADELTAKRYNKISVEGLKSEGISGMSHAYEDDFLEEFTVVLDNYILHNRNNRKGRLVML